MTMSMLPPRTKAPSPRGEGARHSIQSVDRAVFLLETIAALGGEASLTELAGRTGLNISTCHHLLATLIKRGLAAKVPGKRLYTLGTRILSLGHAFLKVDLPRRAQPYLEAVSRSTGETIYLAALRDGEMVTVAILDARHTTPQAAGQVGKVVLPHATSLGKAIMAWLPEEEIHRLLKGGMKRCTNNTITELPALVESLQAVRRDGYAMDEEEYRLGRICIGAAIRDQSGTVIGALAAATQSARASKAHIALLRDEVFAATRALSAEFGAAA